MNSFFCTGFLENVILKAYLKFNYDTNSVKIPGKKSCICSQPGACLERGVPDRAGGKREPAPVGLPGGRGGGGRPQREGVS